MYDIRVYGNGERVLIEAEVVNREFKGEEVRYGLKDPRTGKFFDYTYSHNELFPVERKENDRNNNEL